MFLEIFGTSSRRAAALTVALVLTLLATLAAQTPCGPWQTLPTPEPGLYRNVVLDLAASDGALFALMRSTDQEGTAAPVTYHLLQWTGEGWSDHGAPPAGDLENPPALTCLTVGPDGTVWLGGRVAWHPVLPARPAVVQWSPAEGWQDPEMIDLINQVVYPNTERGGDVRALTVAADGTVFAVGLASGFGNALDTSVPLFLVHDGQDWVEIADPQTNWPGSFGAGTFLADIVAFGPDDAWAVGRHPTGEGLTSGGLVVHWDGSGLTLLEDPREGGIFLGRDLRGLAAGGPDDLWAVGDGTTAGGPTTTLARYDGSGWTLAESPYPGVTDLGHVVLADDGTGWATPVFASDAAPYFDGDSWSLQPFTADTEVRIFAMARGGDGALWAVGDREFLFPHAMRLQCADPTAAPGVPDVLVHAVTARPNPFNPRTTIRFGLSAPTMATLGVYDLAGRQLRLLQSGRLPAGDHAFRWDGRDGAGRPLGTGVYLYRLQAGPEVSTGKLSLVK
jgi:hypothetical protein